MTNASGYARAIGKSYRKAPGLYFKQLRWGRWQWELVTQPKGPYRGGVFSRKSRNLKKAVSESRMFLEITREVEYLADISSGSGSENPSQRETDRTETFSREVEGLKSVQLGIQRHEQKASQGDT